jgi:ankyrin repeat protein
MTQMMRMIAFACTLCLLAPQTLAGAYDDYFQAIKTDDTRTLTTLLFRGMDPNTVGPDGLPGLVLAARDGSLKSASLLLSQNKTKIEARSLQDESALMMASLNGYEELAKALIAKGADVNKTGWTPLHYAATKGHIRIIKLLLEKFAYIDAESPNKSTPLMMAAMYGTFDSLKLLIDEGADVLLKNDLNLTALDFARQANRSDSAALLLKAVEAKRPKGSW